MLRPLRGGLKWLVSGIPAVFMAVMTIWACIINQLNFIGAGNALLYIINICIIITALWIVVESVIKFFTTGEITEEPTTVTT
jgi:carbon starvation protein